MLKSAKQEYTPLGSVDGRPVEILMVEDDPDDASLTMETLEDSQMSNNVTLVEDGMEAITYLRRQGNFATAAQPDLVLLDLNLPKKTGHEVLAEIKNDPNLRRIPVIMISNSASRKDVMKSYDLHANCYVQKPQNANEFIMTVRKIEDFWNTFAKLPPAA
jgi:CheY-like chemotaxis protein